MNLRYRDERVQELRGKGIEFNLLYEFPVPSFVDVKKKVVDIATIAFSVIEVYTYGMEYGVCR